MTTKTQLILGDCREVLKTIGPVDTVITDPVWPNAPTGMFLGVSNPEELLEDALALIEARRVVIVLRADSDPRFLRAVPERWPFFRLQILPYLVPEHRGRFLGGMEIAYCFGEPLPSAKGRRVIPGHGPTIRQGKASRANGHPCPRALKHMEWLVSWWSLPGEVVLDPFMGSGQTIAACAKLQRNGIGIEIVPKWFYIAQRVVAEARLQLPMAEFFKE